MTLIQLLLSSPQAGSALSTDLLKRFSPVDIRETIQSLVATDQMNLANALGDAGLAIYPRSEDILAITSLLAMANQDWPLAVELMDELMEIQGNNVQPFTYVMMVRALRCNVDPARAIMVARKGLEKYPSQIELQAEKLALEDYDGHFTFSSSSSQKDSGYTSSPEARLNSLKTLLDQKLITQDEYELKRRKIIDDI